MADLPQLGFNIVVNFSKTSTNDFELIYPIDVRLGFTDDMSALTSITPPTLLFPGMNLIGHAQVVIRQRFKTPALFEFGFFNVSTSVPHLEFIQLNRIAEVEIVPCRRNEARLQQC